ncbi:MAG: M23 family metallopeptidase [Leptolyngbyaceae cyanobacterium CRU_2_3]|nr:M23 family metallopeptidase [Leptolyngbyaceae cyanobacterium CRU_2_3]
MGWKQWLWAQRRWGIVSLAIVTLLSVLNSAAVSSIVSLQASPTNPQLGDTISVFIQTDATDEAQPDAAQPTVVMNQKTYPTFAIAPHQFRALLPTTPLDRPGQFRIQVNGTGEPKTTALQLRDRDFPTQSIWLSGGGSDGTDYEFDKVDAFKAIVSPEKFWNGKFQRPSQGEISTVYGVRRYYNGEFAQDYFHRGVDYAAGTGSPVVAPAAGKVVLVGREADGFTLHGNTIGVDHGQGVTSIFIHLSRIDVKEGDFVQIGQPIGAVGSTGAATGPHLHWGLYVNGQSVDPVPWRYNGFE